MITDAGWAQAHEDFLKIIGFDHPQKALDYVAGIPEERRRNIRIYIEVNKERDRRHSKAVKWLMFLLFTAALIYMVIQ